MSALYRRSTSDHKPTRSMKTERQSWFGKLLQRLVFIGVAAAIVIGGGVGLIWGVGPRIFSLDQQKNIVFVSEAKDGRNNQIIFAVFSPETHEIKAARLPADMALTVIGNYGTYQLGALQPLLTLEKKSPEFQRASFSVGLGRSIDEVMILPDTEEVSEPTQLKTWLKTVVRDAQSAQTALELYFFSQQTRPPRITLQKLENVEQWQSFIKTLPKIPGSQDCAVAVVNATSAKGLANTVGSILENSQLQVIRVTDTNQAQANSTMYLRDEETCETVIPVIGDLLPTPTATQVDANLALQYRADVVVMLGSDVQQIIKPTQE